MRKLLVVLFVLMFAASLSAQVRTGNIYGKVVDEDANPLPGVTVTLTGSQTAPLTSITSAEGVFRFISLPAANDYAIKGELEGFQTGIQDGIIISVGVNVNLVLTMTIGALSEEVTVTAVTPVVDTKKTTVAQNVTRDVLQSLPTARDPWVIMQQAPGVTTDRENVGGSESGQQSGQMAKGGGQDQWAMDGVTITDPSSISSPGYYDFDSFEEINITLGGADVTVQGAGIQLNLVSRRGGNQPSLGGRFFFTDGSKFQADNLTDELRAEGIIGTNRIRTIKDFGFNFGGPLFKDKVWYWMSYGVQNIFNSNIRGVYEATDLNNYAAKLNIQLIPDNRFEAFAHIGGKEKTARDSSAYFPGGFHQSGAFYFGSPIFKLQDEHMFGENLFVSFKFAYGDSGFNLIPEDDLQQDTMYRYDVAGDVYRDSYWAYNTFRPQNQFNFLASYFNDDFLGASHEVKVGFEYAYRGTGSRWSSSGNANINYNYNTLRVDVTGDNVKDLVPGLQMFSLYRADPADIIAISNNYTAFLSDTMSFGRFSLNVGIRWDKQVPKMAGYTVEALQTDNPAIIDNVSAAAIAAMEGALPGVDSPEVIPDYNWNYITPRLGMTYDITGDGKTIAKASFGQFREYMGTNVPWWFQPRGTGGWMDFWWMEDVAGFNGNGNGIVDLNEVYWVNPDDWYPQRAFDDAGNLVYYDVDAAQGEMWGGYDIDSPNTTTAPNITVANAPAARTTEMIFSIEREVMNNLGVAVDFSYRKFDKFRWDLDWDRDIGESSIENKSEYVAAGTIPATIPGYDLGEGAGKTYYLPSAAVGYRPNTYRTERPDYYRDYMGFEVRFNKRLSNRWMLNGSATYQLNKVHYGTEGLLDITNKWALDGEIYAPNMGGGSGKISTPHSQNWMFKLSGLYQLPYEFNVSFTFNARQGNPLIHRIDIEDFNAPNSRYQYVDNAYLDKPDAFRLPNFWNLNLRLEKVVRVGDNGRVYLMADLFNVFNKATMLRRYEQNHGTYYPHDGTIATWSHDNEANEVLNPRVLRFGVRFQF